MLAFRKYETGEDLTDMKVVNCENNWDKTHQEGGVQCHHLADRKQMGKKRRERERERERESERERETDRQTNRQRQTDKQTDKQTDLETNADRQTTRG